MEWLLLTAGLECDGEFISPEYICNYQWDCSDGSDEEDCGESIDLCRW